MKARVATPAYPKGYIVESWEIALGVNEKEFRVRNTHCGIFKNYNTHCGACILKLESLKDSAHTVMNWGPEIQSWIDNAHLPNKSSGENLEERAACADDSIISMT